MKKILAWILVGLMLLTSAAFAETVTKEELEAQIAELQAQLEALTAEDGSAEPAAEDETTEEAPEFVPLEKGAKGDDVKKLQQRLIELNYLTGSADGDFGNKTKVALEMFQKEAELEITGIADEATLEAIYADDAPAAKTYEKLDYKKVLRDPDANTGKYFKFTGKVFQLVGEKEYDDYIYTVLFVSANGSSNNLCNVTYERPKNSPRILEDDRVTIYAVCDGLYTYETVRGNSNTILDFTAEAIEN